MLLSAISFSDALMQMLGGFGKTCELFFVTLACALPLGLIIAFASMTKFKPLRWLTQIIVWIVRGTPLMLQIFVIFYLPGLLFDTPMQSRFIAASVAFIINYACYFSVIYRGGIESIPLGQHEASQVLGLTKGQTFGRIILPQVIRRILPPMSNEIITLVKDTSLANVIAVSELIIVSQQLVNKYVVLWPLICAGAFYLIFNGILTLLFGFMEKKMNYYKV